MSFLEFWYVIFEKQEVFSDSLISIGSSNSIGNQATPFTSKLQNVIPLELEVVERKDASQQTDFSVINEQVPCSWNNSSGEIGNMHIREENRTSIPSNENGFFDEKESLMSSGVSIISNRSCIREDDTTPSRTKKHSSLFSCTKTSLNHCLF